MIRASMKLSLCAIIGVAAGSGLRGLSSPRRLSSCDKTLRLLSKGASYTLDPPSVAPYEDSAEGRLTNGDINEKKYNGVEASVGWGDPPNFMPKIVVDLGYVASITSVRIHLGGGGEGGIRMPRSIGVWSTTLPTPTGEHNPIKHASLFVDHTPTEAHDAASIWIDDAASNWIRIDTPAIKGDAVPSGRYITFELKPKNEAFWIMVGEVEVYGYWCPEKASTATALWNAAEGTSPDQSAVEARINDHWDAISAAVLKAGISTPMEFAMFMANVMQESDQLTAIAESKEASGYTDEHYNWGVCKGVTFGEDDTKQCHWTEWVDGKATVRKETNPARCCKGQGCKDKCKHQYSGRGYLQITWYHNYKAASASCTTDGQDKAVDIVAEPGLVAIDESLAWCTAAYYWKQNVWTDGRCANDKCDMGNTISAINGDLECDAYDSYDSDGVLITKHPESAQRRFCFYKHFYESYVDVKLYWADSVCMNGKDLAKKCPL